MSHFFTLVLVPNGTKRIKSFIEDILEPYSEELKVEEYERKCYCVGSKAREEVRARIDEELGTIDVVRKDFYLQHTEFDSDKFFDEDAQAAWEKEVYEPRERRQDELMMEHAKKDLPDKKCEECKGTGKYKTTYNPESKWDWWELGGRWSESIPNDKKPVKEILELDDEQFKDCVPYALVTPDGTWHERGQMGWWGISIHDKDKDVWHKEVRGLLEENRDCLAVVVDCHI